MIGMAALVYLAGWFLYVGQTITSSRFMSAGAFILVLFAWMGNSAAMAMRWMESHRSGFPYIPITNQYESLVLLGWAIALLFLLTELKYRKHHLGVLAVPLAFFSLGIANMFFHTDVRPLVPALQSNWLTAHVITCFLGYAAFSLAFAVSVLYIAKRSFPELAIMRLFPSLELLDEINYKFIALGFPFLSMGIITGAVWAEVAWGSYWSWDPKEVWSLITWLVYAIFLHARHSRGWTGPKAAVMSMVGFFTMLFTYFGVNYLLQGLHSYA
jgi:cytochrome c-type biogenesis protein CcsB